ncbi:MAG TPA: two-component sensor histidine kinase [Rhodocyclaceae bacterium]|nr:two-component sensor histidine kinase [Rhodocyclaceae bacterium]
MKRLFDLSFRYKIPLWGSVLIVTAALFVASSLMFRAYEDLRRDLYISADGLARTLAKTLFPAILHDNVWQAFEIVRAPFHGASPEHPVQAELVLVVDDRQQIYVSDDPKTLPMLTGIRHVSEEFAALAQRIAELGASPGTHEFAGSKHIYFITPIADGEALLGHLVLGYSREAFFERFLDIARNAAGIAALVVTVLLPINWYWGRRTAEPLVRLAARMSEVGHSVPAPMEPGLYAYRDELGRLFEAYERMVTELRGKKVLEREMVRSERLAAVGRLSAGIAHEINNPLAGMLTAISTLKEHGHADVRTLKTMALVERGLQQIRDTVAALLVQARLVSRNLAAQDLEDVRTLLEPEAQRKAARIEWQCEVQGEVDLPATLVRQILINLMLNAINAAGERGSVRCRVALEGNCLEINVANDGRPLPEEVKERLFEPFTTTGSGPGLGLWVTYQIVQQLGGRIAARSGDGLTFFTVSLPASPAPCVPKATASA